MMLQDRIALVTGAGKGLGKAIAEHFAKEGASLLLCSRTQQDLDAVAQELTPHLTSNQRIVTAVADVAKREEVDRLFETLEQTFSKLDILVNNAGIYGPFGPIESVDWDEWVEAIGVNLLGSVYCCRKAIPLLRRQGRGKIINLSGGGATTPLPRISAYAASKAAVVRFIETLALELVEDRIDVNAIAPGALATQMTDQLLRAGKEAVGAAFYAKILKVKEEGGTPLEKGAQLAVFLASSQSDGITGKLISAVWDPWKDLHRFKKELKETDIYSLRRIEPKDRNRVWP